MLSQARNDSLHLCGAVQVVSGCHTGNVDIGRRDLSAGSPREAGGGAEMVAGAIEWAGWRIHQQQQ